MVLAQGFLTLSTSGLNTFNLGTSTTPQWIDVVVCAKIGDTQPHLSLGYGIAGNQRCFSIATKSYNSSMHIARHYEGTTLVLSAKLHAFTSTGVQFNVDVPNTAYQVFVRVGT